MSPVTRVRNTLKRLLDASPAPIQSSVRKLIRDKGQNRSPKSNTPKLSIIVPVYNVEEYIEQTLDSLLQQTLTDWEAIIVDDGSTDRSPDIVEAYASADDRFHIIHQENSGLGAARNTGIEHAVGKYLTFLDSDDLIPDDAYKSATETLDKTKSDFAIGGITRLKDSRTYTPAWTRLVHRRNRLSITVDDFPDVLMDVVACNRIFRRKFWVDHVGSFPVGVAYEDHRVMVSAFVRASKFDVLSKNTYVWRVRDDQTSISQQKAELQNLLDRMRAKDETYAMLSSEAPVSTVSAWLTRVIDSDIPLFAKPATESDESYRQQAQKFAFKYTELSDDSVWKNVRWQQRVKALLMARGNWDELSQFLLDLRGNSGVPGTEVSNGVVHLDTSSWDDRISQILGDRTLLGERHTQLETHVDRSKWTETGLVLGGFSYISNVKHSDDSELTLQLVNTRTGQGVTLPVSDGLSSDYASRFANHQHFDYGQSGFEATISWNVIDSILTASNSSDSDVWRIHAKLKVGSISRSGVVDLTKRNASGGALYSVLTADCRYSVVPERDSNGLLLRFVRVEALLTELSDLSVGFSGKLRFVKIRNTPIKSLHIGEVVLSGDNVDISPDQRSLRFTCAQDISDLENARLKLEFSDGRTKNVVWDLDESGFSVGRSYCATRSGSGFVDFHSRTRKLIATGASIDAGVLRVEISGPDTQSLRSLDAHLTNLDGSCVLTASPAASNESSSHSTVCFDMNVTTEFGSSLHGAFHLTVGSTPVMPSIPLMATMPKSFLTEYYRLECTRGGNSQDRALRVTIGPPLSDSEIGTWNQLRLRDKYRSFATTPPTSNVVMFQCYRGEIASDNQLAICEEVQRRDSQMDIYWGVLDGSIKIPAGTKRAIIGSSEWYRVLGEAKYLCNNIDFDRWFLRRPGQSFLQTFHGHPFKAMGKTFWASKNFNCVEMSHEIKRRQDAWTDVVMPNTESIGYYVDEYDYHGNYLVTGYPRNDAIVQGDESLARNGVANRYSLTAKGKRWVLFAPTWRESSATGAWSAKMVDDLDLGVLASLLGPSWTILVRGHNYNAREDARVERSASVVDVTDYPEINDLILASDAAILDYSSLRFDWAITRKPVVFFVPDKDEYLEHRPGLFDFDESAPGPQTTRTKDVASELLRSDSYLDVYGPQLDTFNQRFNALSDGKAAERVVDAFFTSASTGSTQS